ncbi:unnamed protein product [Amoebophrya sp. A120]|nr:unnamed protein product [Amoebophrya sp. A120]|eukprot:GSA120T00023124001.1
MPRALSGRAFLRAQLDFCDRQILCTPLNFTTQGWSTGYRHARSSRRASALAPSFSRLLHRLPGGCARAAGRKAWRVHLPWR